MIITIDGPSGSGKSTIAKELAKFLGYTFFDTGAMYRSLTYFLTSKNVPATDTAAVVENLKSFEFNIKTHMGVKHYFLGEQDITDAIRSREVSRNVSKYAAIPEVRKELVKLQRQVAKNVNAVFEGRDMGTVVFPEADLKIFLEADNKERARRRYEEIIAKDPSQKDQISLEEILNDIIKRDHQDSNREVSPLMKAEDAHLIDTTNLSIDEVVKAILEIKDKQIQQRKLRKE